MGYSLSNLRTGVVRPVDPPEPPRVAWIDERIERMRTSPAWSFPPSIDEEPER